MTDVYIDASVFIAAACDTGKDGDASERFLEDVHAGAHRAYTSTLTVDEMLWVVKKTLGREEAAKAAKLLFNLSHLGLVDATGSIVSDAVEVFLHERVEPRDAIHVATMRSRRVVHIASLDADFDSVKGIKRLSPAALGKMK